MKLQQLYTNDLLRSPVKFACSGCMAPEVAVFPGCWLEPDYPLEEPEK